LDLPVLLHSVFAPRVSVNLTPTRTSSEFGMRINLISRMSHRSLVLAYKFPCHLASRDTTQV